MFANEENERRFSAVWEYLNGDYPTSVALVGAQGILDDDKNRDAEWHYVQAAVHYYRRFYLDCKKHLKKAIKLDPQKGKYQAALAELEEMAKNAKAAGKPLPDDKRGDFFADCCTGCCTSCC